MKQRIYSGKLENKFLKAEDIVEVEVVHRLEELYFNLKNKNSNLLDEEKKNTKQTSEQTKVLSKLFFCF